MSKKMIFVGVGGALLVGVCAAAGYYLAPQFLTTNRVPPPAPKDLTGIVVAPVEFPLKGFQMQVPGTSDQVVSLDLVAPSATRDLPMARFTHASTSQVMTLVAHDQFTTDVIAGWRAVPLALSQQGTSTQWYLARLQQTNDTWAHIDSIFLGEDIRLSGVAVSGENVEVQYLVHDREQASTEVPRVSTTAIVTLPTAFIVQAGRTPKNEAIIEYKRFTGEYVWQSTTDATDTVVTPTTPDAFTLRFDANRVALGTDCNSGSAVFATQPIPATEFTVEPIASTKMFCESAQEAAYFAMIEQIVSYEETTEALMFTLADDSVMVFVPKVRDLQFESASEVTPDAAGGTSDAI